MLQITISTWTKALCYLYGSRVSKVLGKIYSMNKYDLVNPGQQKKCAHQCH